MYSYVQRFDCCRNAYIQYDIGLGQRTNQMCGIRTMALGTTQQATPFFFFTANVAHASLANRTDGRMDGRSILFYFLLNFVS